MLEIWKNDFSEKGKEFHFFLMEEPNRVREEFSSVVEWPHYVFWHRSKQQISDELADISMDAYIRHTVKQILQKLVML